jgi:ActR/RegA family two-component response regulator
MTTENDDRAEPPSWLVVDADEPASRALKRVLEGTGYRNHAAKDVDSAVCSNAVRH